MRSILFTGLMAALSSAQVSAQTAPFSHGPAYPALSGRANDLVFVMNGSGDVSQIFASDFLAQISEAKLRAIAAQITAQLGKATGIAVLTPTSPSSASMRMSFEQGSAEMTLALGADGRIIGWRILGVDNHVVSAIANLAGIAAAFQALPGETGFVVTDLAHSRAPIAGLMPMRALAIGSAFKLVVLAELVRAIDAGERHWDDLVTLDGSELPGGIFTQIPAGTKVPVRRLAEAMIKVSDNSAADILIHTLGRERIEAMQAQVGLHDGAANTPFLTTMEMFKLKGIDHRALGKRYLTLDREGRRALLAGEVARAAGADIGALFADGRPVMIDRIEWFASSDDLARVMAWFNDHRTTAGGSEAMRLLALNPGISAKAVQRFAYVGYKGGSEPGVISMTLLLRTGNGHAKVLSASWNNKQAAVNEGLFVSLMSRAAELLIEP